MVTGGGGEAAVLAPELVEEVVLVIFGTNLEIGLLVPGNFDFQFT